MKNVMLYIHNTYNDALEMQLIKISRCSFKINDRIANIQPTIYHTLFNFLQILFFCLIINSICVLLYSSWRKQLAFARLDFSRMSPSVQGCLPVHEVPCHSHSACWLYPCLLMCLKYKMYEFICVNNLPFYS